MKLRRLRLSRDEGLQPALGRDRIEPAPEGEKAGHGLAVARIPFEQLQISGLRRFELTVAHVDRCKAQQRVAVVRLACERLLVALARGREIISLECLVPLLDLRIDAQYGRTHGDRRAAGLHRTRYALGESGSRRA